MRASVCVVLAWWLLQEVQNFAALHSSQPFANTMYERVCDCVIGEFTCTYRQTEVLLVLPSLFPVSFQYSAQKVQLQTVVHISTHVTYTTNSCYQHDYILWGRVPCSAKPVFHAIGRPSQSGRDYYYCDKASVTSGASSNFTTTTVVTFFKRQAVLIVQLSVQQY